jgi:hypothetical protein
MISRRRLLTIVSSIVVAAPAQHPAVEVNPRICLLQGACLSVGGQGASFDDPRVAAWYFPAPNDANQ